MTKLEELLEWMDSAEYAPTYGELREKVKSLITDEQQVKSVDLADVVGRSEQLVCDLCDKDGWIKENKGDIIEIRLCKCDKAN